MSVTDLTPIAESARSLIRQYYRSNPSNSYSYMGDYLNPDLTAFFETGTATPQLSEVLTKWNPQYSAGNNPRSFSHRSAYNQLKTLSGTIYRQYRHDLLSRCMQSAAINTDTLFDSAFNYTRKTIRNYFRNKTVTFPVDILPLGESEKPETGSDICQTELTASLTIRNVVRFFPLEQHPDGTVTCLNQRMIQYICGDSLSGILADLVMEAYPGIQETAAAHHFSKAEYTAVLVSLLPGGSSRLLSALLEEFGLDTVLALLKKNSRYKSIADELHARLYSKISLQSSMLNHIPEHYTDLYPLARKLHRHIVLHVGPTNSGKTFDAVQALLCAKSGIYLAPLRLLAYEQYETINAQGVPCILLTGEESISVENASHQSSTIEMLDPEQFFELAVIDEAQMISDAVRGGAWTQAILGVRAETVHICAAPEAEPLLLKLIAQCGDSVEVVRHERKTQLKFEENLFHFPESVRPGDALIVFSRRDVHAVAAVLQQSGINCSIIYGALPYDVRHEEARKFNSGLNEVVVATDAIGMGLNMPIRRIVFLQTSKYDGTETRQLTRNEVLQIAGRAGRLGMYDEGLCNTIADRNYIRSSLSSPCTPLETAVIGFPPSLLSLDADLSVILNQWNDVPVNLGFVKEDLSAQIRLCENLSQHTNDKYLIYRFITIPFDSEDATLLELWKEFFFKEIQDEPVSFSDIQAYLPRGRLDLTDLSRLEFAYKICDLTYYYMTRFHHEEDISKVNAKKAQISTAIMKILSQQKLESRHCRRCGVMLPWDHPYSLCESCYGRHFFNYY